MTLEMADSNHEFRNAFKQVPLGIAILRGEAFIVEMANDTYLQIVHKNRNNFVGHPFFNSLPEAKEVIHPILTQVFNTGLPYYTDELNLTLHRHGKNESCFFNLVYHPLKAENDSISGVIIIAYEITEAVQARHLLAESAKEFKKLVMESPIPMAIFRGRNHNIEMANKAMLQTIWKRKKRETLGKDLLDAFPELREQKYPELLHEVFNDGKARREKESVRFVQNEGRLQKFYFDFEYTPLFEKDGGISGIMVTLNDVTEKVETRKKVEDAEERARLAAEIAEIATWELDLQTQAIIHSANLPAIFGHHTSVKLSYIQILNQLDPEDRINIVEKAFEMAMQTSIYKYEARVYKINGETRWIRWHGKIFFDEYNEPLKMIGTLIDITEERTRRETLMESEQKFRLLADSMPQHIWTADPSGALNYFNKSVFDFSGLTELQLKNGGWQEIVHPDDREENIKQWIHAVGSGTDFLFEHRFLRHDGQYRWQLSRAIAQKDHSGNIQMWVGTSTDIQDQKTFTNLLEKQVGERTAELESKNSDLIKMNIELESFAYVSSHDLQEPLRKIQMFISRIEDVHAGNLPAETNDYFNKIKVAAFRMQRLIQDLLEYSRTNSAESVFVKIDLGDLFKEVKNDFREAIEETGAIIDVANLCEVKVIPFQFRQLLNNLIGNSLKFNRPGIRPHISIKAGSLTGKNIGFTIGHPEKSYCHITISDNGIGFDDEFNDKIFQVFKRLHSKEEYSGTGIGLAIVKKIVENHNGIIRASGVKNQGATFDIYIPES